MDNIKDTINNVAKGVFKSSKSFLKSTKLSMDLSAEESKLKAIYVEIGKKVHEIYAYGGSLGKFFDEKYKELLECENKADALRKSLDDAKGTKTCPKCGKASTQTSEFCPKCGVRMSDGAEAAAFPEQSYHGAGYSEPYPERYERPIPPQPERYEKPAPLQAESYDQPAALKRCGVCGKENAAENKFCFSCGRLI